VLPNVNTDHKFTRRLSFIIERLGFVSDFITRILVRLDLYRILTEVMRKIFEGSMKISVIRMFLFIAMTLHFDFSLGLLCSH
jgi:hypothetical protein